MPQDQGPIVLCKRTPQFARTIREFAEALKTAAPEIGNHGMSEAEFWDSGLFRGAVERLRGQQVASMTEKRAFAARVLDLLKQRGSILDWNSSGSSDRHDYEMTLADGRIAVIEAKGCLDGNNTNIFERPPHADEFLIWSLCQNPGADPRHNAWSGIHTRLSADIIHRRQKVDGLIIWDMVCGTIGRPCPKLERDPDRVTTLGDSRVPPPCIYLFPRSIPDPRSNPAPSCWRLEEVHSLKAFHDVFRGRDEDIVEVRIEAEMIDATTHRTVRLLRSGVEFMASDPTPIQRANR